MALSPKDILSALEWDFLSFFSGDCPFFLTAGTALSAFYDCPYFFEEVQEYFQSLARKLAVESFPQ
jgi:hypothetical protein